MLLSHIEHLVDAGSVREVREAYLDALRDHGYSHAYYAASFHSDLPPAIVREDPEQISSFPLDFVARMREIYHLSNCPLTDWAAENSGDIALSQLAAQEAHDSEIRQISEICTSHGMGALRIISLKGRVARANGLVLICPAALARPNEENNLWRKNRGEVIALTTVMHMRMATIGRDCSRTVLTPRQREVLEWTSAGKTVAEVATILGLTSATVEKHLRLARDSLDAGSTAQAILKAHVTGQIFLPAVEKQADGKVINTSKGRPYRI